MSHFVFHKQNITKYLIKLMGGDDDKRKINRMAWKVVTKPKKEGA